MVRCGEDVLWLHKPGSESLVSESLESVTSSLLVVAKWNTYVCLHCCNPLSILSVMWTTIPNLWPSVKQSWGHTVVLFGAFRKKKTLKHWVSALTPIHVWLQTKRTPEVCAVADVKNSAVIAALTTLLR